MALVVAYPEARTVPEVKTMERILRCLLNRCDDLRSAGVSKSHQATTDNELEFTNSSIVRRVPEMQRDCNVTL